MLPLECPFCDHANPSDANYCNKCGQRLKLKACPQCAVVNNDTAETCYQCGSAFPADAAPDAARAACDQLRRVLASDLRAGSLPPSEAPAPQPDAGTTSGAASTVDEPPALQRIVRAHDYESAIARAEFAAERPHRALPLSADPLLRPDFDLVRALRPDLSHDEPAGPGDPRTGSTAEPAAPSAGNPAHAPGAGPSWEETLQMPAARPAATRRWRVPLLVAIALAAIGVLGYYLYGALLGDQATSTAGASNSSAPRHLPIRETNAAATTPATPNDRPAVAPIGALGVIVPAADEHDNTIRPGESRAATVSADRLESAARRPNPTAAGPRSVAKSAPAVESQGRRADDTPPPSTRIPACTQAVATLGLCTPGPNEEAK